LVCAAIALFVAHEPLLVVLGVRGAWAKSQHGSRALRTGFSWTGIALASGVGGLWLGGESVIRGSALPVALVLTLMPIVVRGAEKTLAGEVVAALALAAAALPVAVAGGLLLEKALAVWAVWGVAFATSTSAVHWVISAHKGRRNRPSLALAAVTTAVAVVLGTQSSLLLSALPMLLVSWVLVARPPHARHLKRIGWSLLVSGTLTATTSVALVRIDNLESPAPRLQPGELHDVLEFMPDNEERHEARATSS
jgi:hypothetical protein